MFSGKQLKQKQLKQVIKNLNELQKKLLTEQKIHDNIKKH